MWVQAEPTALNVQESNVGSAELVEGACCRSLVPRARVSRNEVDVKSLGICSCKGDRVTCCCHRESESGRTGKGERDFSGRSERRVLEPELFDTRECFALRNRRTPARHLDLESSLIPPPLYGLGGLRDDGSIMRRVCIAEADAHKLLELAADQRCPP